jgi:hypothetical protein
VKEVKTLVKDIYDWVSNPTPVPEEDVKAFSDNLARHLTDRLTRNEGPRTLRVSNLGQPCDRKLWQSINTPEKAEPLQPYVKLKFLIGDLLEEVVKFLARAAGHKVEGEQQEVDVNGVKGRLDCIIDGHVVDIKSASTRGFDKFRDHGLRSDDPFGYLTQLGAYLEGVQLRDEVKDKNSASFLAFDKQHAHIHLDTYNLKDVDHAKIVDQKRAMLAGPIPDRLPDEDGGNGNRILGMACSYCEFKRECFPGLRAFNYSGGPKFFTKIAKHPYNRNGPIREIKL